jgi:phosphoenolpyruvate carboxykinase (GTP)
MADYFGHWLRIGREADAAKLPRVFLVNWFRKDPDGRFIWPGFGENSRVLEYIFRRCEGEGETVETPIGLVPAAGELNTDGLPGEVDLETLLSVDHDELRGQLPQIEAHLAQFGDGLPDEIGRQLDALRERLG